VFSNCINAIFVESQRAWEQLEHRGSGRSVWRRYFDLFGEPGRDRTVDLVGPVGGTHQEDGLFVA
jgi:hypothetical protein